jgi:transposase
VVIHPLVACYSKVQRWLTRHKRVTFHFTPTGASWLNMVETWFSILTRRSVRRGTYASVPELIDSIQAFITGYNQRAKPFTWTKTADDILTKAQRKDTSETDH